MSNKEIIDFTPPDGSIVDTDSFLKQSAGGTTVSVLWSTIKSYFLPTFTSGSVPFSNGTTLLQDNANFFWNDTTNRLGIGTNAPGATLDVATGQIRGPNGIISAGGIAGISFTGFSNDGFSSNGTNLGVYQAGVLSMVVANGLKEVRLPADYFLNFSSATANTSTSDVGIGRSSAGILRATGSLLVRRDQTTDVGVTVANAGTVSATTTASFSLAEGGAALGWLRRYRDGSGHTELAWSNNMIFTGGIGTTPVERMRITTAGNVGIGTVSPFGLLSVNGANIALPTTGVYQQLEITGGTSDALRLSLGVLTSIVGTHSIGTGVIQSIHNGSAFTNLLLNPSGGNVGIGTGTAAPAHRLTVVTNSTSNGSGAIVATHNGAVASTGWAGYFIKTGASGTNVGIHAEASGGTQNYAGIFIGRVGIGLTTPTSLLHLAAGTATTGTAPLQFTAGVVNTTPQQGCVEFTNSETGLTFTAVATRRAFVLDTATQTLTNKTLTSPILDGTISGTGVATGATANTLALRDANGNLNLNNWVGGYTSTASSAGTTVLTVASSYEQRISGTTTHTFTLPVASTLAVGHTFLFINDSTGAVTINSSGGNLVNTLPAGGRVYIICILNSGTTAASWTTAVIGGSGGSSAPRQFRISIPGELVADTAGYQGFFWYNDTGSSITISNVAVAVAKNGTTCSVNLYKSSGTAVDGIDTNAVNLFTSAIALGSGYTSLTNVPNTTTVEAGRWVSGRVTAVAGAPANLQIIVTY